MAIERPIKVKIVWLKRDAEGEVIRPRSGGEYRPTTAFVGPNEDPRRHVIDPDEQHWSLFLHFIGHDGDESLAEGRFLRPDLIGERASVGAHLILYNGPEVVGSAEIVAVDK